MGPDDAGDIRAHGVHQKVVARVSLASGHLGYPCTVRHGGHTRIAYERVDFPALFQEEVEELHEENSAGRRNHE